MPVSILLPIDAHMLIGLGSARTTLFSEHASPSLPSGQSLHEDRIAGNGAGHGF